MAPWQRPMKKFAALDDVRRTVDERAYSSLQRRYRVLVGFIRVLGPKVEKQIEQRKHEMEKLGSSSGLIA